MKRLLIDASVAMGWCLRQDQFIPDVDVAIESVHRHGGVVPRIFWSEVRSVLLRLERQGKIRVGSAERHLRKIRKLSLITDDSSDESAILSLSRRHRLRGYDTEYLETAIRTGSELATVDKALDRAGRAEHVVFDSWRTSL